MKRIMLFVLTNIAVIAVMSVVLSVLGVDRFLSARGLNLGALMVFSLVVAFIVDGMDGPLARRYKVKVHAAQYDGVLMDLIIDYLTYVFIPAYALFGSGLLPGWTGWCAIIVITFISRDGIVLIASIINSGFDLDYVERVVILQFCRFHILPRQTHPNCVVDGTTLVCGWSAAPIFSADSMADLR